MAEAEAWVMIPKRNDNGTDIVIDMRPLVLCKDCKHNSPFGCDKHNVIVSDIYFCADGER